MKYLIGLLVALIIVLTPSNGTTSTDIPQECLPLAIELQPYKLDTFYMICLDKGFDQCKAKTGYDALFFDCGVPAICRKILAQYNLDLRTELGKCLSGGE